MEFILLLSLFVLGMPAEAVVTPTIQKPLTAESHYFIRDSPVVMPCKATGEPSYKWYRDGKVVQSEKDRDGNTLISFDSRSGDLTIPKYSDRFNGEYYCVATIGEAASMSQMQILYETRLPPFDPAADTTITKTAYSYVKLPCSNQGKVVGNDISYNWYLSEKSRQVTMDKGRLFIDLTGALHFTYVIPSDATSQWKYLCGYSSTSLKSIRMGNFYILAVNKADPTGTDPLLQYRSENVEGKIGASARLECFFSGYDSNTTFHLPTIKWVDSEKREIKNSAKFELLDNNRALIVKDLKEEDDKNYYCSASTRSGNTDEMPVLLNVTSKPIWVEAPKTQTIAASTAENPTHAVFKCNARSLSNEAEPETPIWYINGKEFSSDLNHLKYQRSNDRKTLTIKNLRKPQDIMCVQCRVRNSNGVLMGDACLNVVTPIKVNHCPPKRQDIKKGDRLNLTIQASSDDDNNNPLSYEWIFGNQTYTKLNKPAIMEYNPRTDETYINTSKISNSQYDKLGGEYILRVYNLYDNKICKTFVKLTDTKEPIVETTTSLPAAAVAASAGIDMWIIGLIIGIIFLIIVIAIIIFVICRKQQEGDYNVDKKETGAGLDPEKELRDKGFNDLSRPDYDDYDYPDKKPRGDLEYDDVPIGGDDESLGEYGDEEDTHFNEDGSFIGIYQKKENERQNHKTESTI